jgi:tetratricopeptide (TPR) repeat protein
MDAPAAEPSAARRALALSPTAWLVALLAGTAILHLLHAAVASHDPYLQFRVGDEAFYDGWARAIAGGALARPEPFFTTPLFAYWLAALYRAGLDSVPAVLAANAVLGTAAVGFTYAAARRLAGPAAGLLAGATVALSRAVLVYEAAPDKTTLVLCLAALAVAAATWAEEAPGPGRWVLAGAAAGAAALAHALVLVLVPAVLVHLARNGGPRRAWRAGAAYAGGALLAVAPATIHNAAASGEAILVCSNGGHNLYLGNHAGNRTGLYTSPPFSRADLAYEEAGFRGEAERRAGRSLRPGEVSSFWARQALREMAATPALSLERFLRKLRWSVNQEEIADTRTYGFYADRLPTTRFLLWDFGLPAALGLVAAAALFKERRLALPIAFAGAYALALGAFFVYGRYRLPLLVPLAILGGTLLSRARALVAERRPVRLAALAAAAAAAAMLVFGRVLPEVEESFFPDYFNQGNRYLAAGRTEEALVEYEKAITVKPGDHPAVAPGALRLAQLHLDRGDRAAAIRVLREAVQVRPGERALLSALAALGG